MSPARLIPSSFPILLGRISLALAVMTLGILCTLASPLPAVVAGIALFTIGFFGVHAVAFARSTAASRPSRYESTPNPAIWPAQAGAMTLVRRNSSRAEMLLRCTSTTGMPHAVTASRMA